MSRRLKIGCAIFIALTIAAVIIPLRFLRSRTVEVDVAPVERADIEETVSAVPVAGQPAGVVKPDEVKVIPKVGGELVALLVEEGDRVSQGQVIAYLDPRGLNLQLIQAQETARAARARVADAREDLRAAPVRSATAVTEARANLEQSTARYDAAVRGARAEEIERARLAVVQAEKDLQDAEASLATVKRGARPEEIAASEASLEQAKTQAESAKAQLDLILAGPRAEEVAQSEAALEEAEAQVSLRETELQTQRALAAKGFISRNALRAAEADYQMAVARRNSARERLATVRTPHRPQEIEQARASYKAATASVARAEQELALVKSRSTPQDVTSATARRDAAQARLEAARADLKLRQNQTAPEDLRIAGAAVRQARASLKRTEVERVAVTKQRIAVEMAQADMRRSQAALDQAAEQAGYTTIRAPIGGVVTRVNVKEGEYVQGGGIALPSAEIAMVVITSDQVWIECNVDEADIGRVSKGQKVDIFLSGDEELEGVVHHVSPSVRLVQGDVRTFAVKVAVTGRRGGLRSGVSVDVDIIVKATPEALSIPSFAVFDDKDGVEYVYAVENGRAKKRKVSVGARGIERVEITDGVKEGEQVITSLEVKGLRDGARVKAREKDADEKETTEPSARAGVRA